MNRRLKPTRPKSMYTRTLYNARAQTSGSIVQGKNAIRTWLWFKNTASCTWQSTTAAGFQWVSESVPINDPGDMSLNAGRQVPVTYATLANLYQFSLADTFVAKLTFNMRNLLPTAAVQALDFLLVDWYDVNPNSSTMMNLLNNAAQVTWENAYERFNLIQRNVRVRKITKSFSGNGNVSIKFSTKMTLAKFFGNSKVDFAHPFDNAASPFAQVRMYGQATVYVAPPNLIYYHAAIVNIGAMYDTNSIFPNNSATGCLCHISMGNYTKFFDPLVWTTANPV